MLVIMHGHSGGPAWVNDILIPFWRQATEPPMHTARDPPAPHEKQPCDRLLYSIRTYVRILNSESRFRTNTFVYTTSRGHLLLQGSFLFSLVFNFSCSSMLSREEHGSERTRRKNTARQAAALDEWLARRRPDARTRPSCCGRFSYVRLSYSRLQGLGFEQNKPQTCIWDL